jgi:hypothetical protein
MESSARSAGTDRSPGPVLPQLRAEPIRDSTDALIAAREWVQQGNVQAVEVSHVAGDHWPSPRDPTARCWRQPYVARTFAVGVALTSAKPQGHRPAKTSRIELRATEDDRDLLDRAAAALGTDRSSFLLTQGRLAAQRRRRPPRVGLFRLPYARALVDAIRSALAPA